VNNTAFEKLLTRKEAAAILGLGWRTVDENIAKGALPIVKIGRNVRIKPSELQKFIEARETRVNPRQKGGRA
jgi:excisionase family DNA binding protein